MIMSAQQTFAVKVLISVSSGLILVIIIGIFMFWRTSVATNQLQDLQIQNILEKTTNYDRIERNITPVHKGMLEDMEEYHNKDMGYIKDELKEIKQLLKEHQRDERASWNNPQ